MNPQKNTWKPVESLKEKIKVIVRKLPFLEKRFNYYEFLKDYYRKSQEAWGAWSPGHFYSTVPRIEDIKRDRNRIYGTAVKDVDFRLVEQFEFIQKLKEYYDRFPYQLEGPASQDYRYNPQGAFYRYSDAIFLFCMLNYCKSRTVVEVGSGHSSAIMMDVNERFFENRIKLTFIEPFPEERLYGVMRPSDQISCTVVARCVQDVDMSVFEELDENDILFIDSSHVSKAGSDVNHIVFEILPRLKKGVYVHFHDIFYPFELPEDWVCEHKFFWNENYLLRAFLMNNNRYEIVLFNSLLHKKYPMWFKESMPKCLLGCKDTGSIWIRKL